MTHEAKLSMRPILSATGTYNYNLDKWLEEKLKPLSVNEYTITDAFEFANDIRSIPMNEGDILVSYDVTALNNDWFNRTCDLNLEKEELVNSL